jgi:hypothetical protein
MSSKLKFISKSLFYCLSTIVQVIISTIGSH